MRDAPAEERHDGVMRDEPDADRARHFQHPLEIVHAQRDAHAEHDDRQSPRDEIAAEPREPGRMRQRQRAADQDPDREKIGGETEDSIHVCRRAIRTRAQIKVSPDLLNTVLCISL